MSLIGNLFAHCAQYNLARGKAEKAEKLYAKAFNNEVTAVRPKIAYGNYLLKKGEFQKAKSIFTEIIIDKRIPAQFRLAAKQSQSLVYWKLGNMDHAIETAREVHSKVKNGLSYQSLGALLVISDEPAEEALTFNLKAYEYDDEDAVILDNLAESYLKVGKTEEAKKYYLEALKVNENQVSSLYNLSKLLINDGNKEAAIEYLERARDEGRFHSLSMVTKQEVEQLLKEL